MNGRTIFQFILLVIGGSILVINFGWWLVLGLFFVLWGNNIQIDDIIKKYIKRLKNEMEQNNRGK